MQELCLTVGARVHLRDGEGGTLHKLVMEPHTHQITHLVILKGRLQRHDYVVPVIHVSKATAQELFVDVTAEELATFPEYRVDEFRELPRAGGAELTHPRDHVVTWMPPVGIFESDQVILPAIRRRVYHGIPLREKVIGRNAIVRTLDDVIGRVDHLWLHRENWEVTHVVVRCGGFSHHYVIVPVGDITSIEPDEIYIRTSDEPLPEFSADELATVMQRALGVEPHAEPYPLDENLKVAELVVATLAADPRTTAATFDVAFEGGVLTLRGDVIDEATHRAAEAIARDVPQVISVVNALEVHPVTHDENRAADAEGAILRMLANINQAVRRGVDAE